MHHQVCLQAMGGALNPPECHSTRIPALQALPAQNPKQDAAAHSLREARARPANKSQDHTPKARHRAHLLIILYVLQHAQAQSKAQPEDAEIVPGHN